jgi:hypothetical protein
MLLKLKVHRIHQSCDDRKEGNYILPVYNSVEDFKKNHLTFPKKYTECFTADMIFTKIDQYDIEIVRFKRKMKIELLKLLSSDGKVFWSESGSFCGIDQVYDRNNY